MTMRETIRRGIERIMDTIVDRIIIFTDYFILKKHITLSETAIFLFSLSWALWFMFVGVYVSEMALSRAAWTTIFMMSTVAHFLSFFFKTVLGRAIVVSFYAFVWCFLMFLSAYTGSQAPAVPTLFIVTFLAIFIAVRLFRERQSPL